MKLHLALGLTPALVCASAHACTHVKWLSLIGFYFSGQTLQCQFFHQPTPGNATFSDSSLTLCNAHLRFCPQFFKNEIILGLERQLNG